MEMKTFEEFQQPFLAIPEPCAYFPAEISEEVRETVFRCLNRGEGISLILGETGLGKTLLLRVLAEQFQINDTVLIISHSRIKNEKSLLQQILFGLNQNFAGCEENELRLLFLDYLRRTVHERFILLIDESQYLPFSVFEEIRSLLDLSNGETSKIRVAFAGNLKFEERLAHPRFAALQQRIVSRSYLEPFTRKETVDYIETELQRAGDLFEKVHFSAEAKNSIHQVTGGVPRLINQLCDHVIYCSLKQMVPENLLNPNELELELSLKNNTESCCCSFIQKNRVVQALQLLDTVFIDQSEISNAWRTLQQLPQESSISLTNCSKMDCSSEISSSLTKDETFSVPNLTALDSVIEFGSLDLEEDENNIELHSEENYSRQESDLDALKSESEQSDSD
ncbi:MAG: AAA family ATPase, partial [Planctomycetia bacterium]|nr:AAA family ATPase [Planctomycetia bacterium]